MRARSTWATLVQGNQRRFLAKPMAVAVAAYAVFAATFASLRVANDGVVYYDFLRRFFGADIAPAGYAYQFGVAFFNAPFYLAARVLQTLGWGSVAGAPLPEASIALASNVALVLTLWLGWRILRDLELPSGPAVLLLTVFGSPLFYYTAFQPSYKHAVDALLLTLAAYLLLRTTAGSRPRLALALGATLGALLTVRYANVALLPGMVAPLLLRRDWARVRLVILGTAIATVLLLALPLARGIPFKKGPGSAAPAQVELSGRRVPLAADGIIVRLLHCPHERYYTVSDLQCLRNRFGVRWDPGAPAKMLGSARRGLFLWTPLTALAMAGFALAFAAQAERRRFLGGLAAAAVLLLLVHAVWGDFWTAGYSFSQRFLSSLFPLYLIGVAELVRRFRLAALAALLACSLFSLYLGFNHFIGYHGISEHDGVGTVLTTGGDRGPGETARDVANLALRRWGLR